MLKEIEEQPTALADTLRGHLVDGRIVLDEQRLSDQELRDIDKVFVVACGTAYHAGLLAKYAIEHWCRIPVEVEVASEFRYRDPVLDRSTLVVAISQSGETADTLEAVRHARDQKARVLAICNTNGAQIPRESDAVLYTHAGPEVGVAATKTFTAQVVGLLPRRPRAGADPRHEVRRRGRPRVRRARVERRRGRPRCCETVVEPTRALARELSSSKAVLFLGRHVGFPVALEGALKLKELAYMHAEGFAAGELKHGPIALIEQDLPVVVVMPSPKGRAILHAKLLSQHPRDPGPRRPDDRGRGGGRRDGAPVRRAPHRGPGGAHAAPAAAWRPCRCRSSPPRSPAPAATTSTSRATSRSPSPSSSRRMCVIFRAIGAEDHARTDEGGSRGVRRLDARAGGRGRGAACSRAPPRAR